MLVEPYNTILGPPSTLDRSVGALMGLAVGDALGTTLEFSVRDSKPLHTEMKGGGPFDLEPGQWTDDTSMALCIAASLVETGSFDPLDQKQRYLEWWKHGYMSSTGLCFDIGSQTMRALDQYQHEVAFGRSPGPFPMRVRQTESGNGGIMRLAPVVVAFSDSIAMAGELAAISSKTTHASEECIEAAVIFGELVAAAIQGRTKPELLEHLHSLEPRITTLKMKTVIKSAFKDVVRENVSSTGYVATSLHAALWAFHQTDTFEDGMVLAINLGGDADTVGAIYGQLAGAFYGENRIPERWRQALYKKEMVRGLALTIAKKCGSFVIVNYEDE